MSIAMYSITAEERAKLLARQEGHFLEIKSRVIQPAKLTKAIAAIPGGRQ